MTVLPPWERRGFFIAPVCASCKVPVDRFHLNPDQVRLVVHAECHGATEVMSIPIEFALRLIQLNRTFAMFKRKAGFNAVNGAVF